MNSEPIKIGHYKGWRGINGWCILMGIRQPSS